MKQLVALGMNKNEIQNVVVQVLASDPSSPVTGQVYYNSATKRLRQYNGATWDEYGTGAGAGDVSSNTSTSVDSEMVLFNGTTGKSIKRASGSGFVKLTSGVVSAVSIAESDVTNLTTDLAAKAPTASPTFTGTVTVPTPSNNTDAATKGYVDNAIQGLSWKTAVRAASTGNLTLSGAQTIDGVSVVAGDRVLVKDQSTASGNGIYVVAAGAWSRATDADAGSELVNATVYVSEGTANADRVWTVTTNASITLGSTSIAWAEVNGGTVPGATTSTAGKVQLATQAEAQAKTDSAKALTAASVADFARKYTGTIGDGSSTSIAVTHGLGSQYVHAQAFDATTNALVNCDITLTSSTQTTFAFSTAPTSNSIRVVIVG